MLGSLKHVAEAQKAIGSARRPVVLVLVGILLALLIVVIVFVAVLLFADQSATGWHGAVPDKGETTRQLAQ